MVFRTAVLSRLRCYFTYHILSKTYSSHVLRFSQRICARRNTRVQWNSSCSPACHDVMRRVITESRARKILFTTEVSMARRRNKYLSVGLAGVLCSTALVGLTMAQPAGGKNNLNLPGLRERPQTPNNTFTRMFPELPPFAPPTDAVREQAKNWAKKEASSMRWIT